MTATSPQENGLSIGRAQFLRKLDTALIVSLATVGDPTIMHAGRATEMAFFE